MSVTLTSSNAVTINTNWKPSIITGSYITTLANDTLAVDTTQIATVASVNAQEGNISVRYQN